MAWLMGGCPGILLGIVRCVERSRRRVGRPEGTVAPDVALQGASTGGTTDLEMNAPEGEGMRSAAYVPPPVDPLRPARSVRMFLEAISKPQRVP